MSRLLLNTKQTREGPGAYDSANCTYGSCTAFNPSRPLVPCRQGDATIGSKLCGVGPAGVNFCHSQYRCTPIDPSVCPILPGQPIATPTVEWTPGVAINSSANWSNPNVLNVQCGYNAADITTALQVGELQRVFSATNPQTQQALDDQLYPTFCSLPSNDCPPDPVTGEPRSICSRFVSSDQEGALCRSWQARNLQQADTSKRRFCNTNPTSRECECINRSSNPTYQQLNPRQQSQDSCWWAPCRNSDAYLVTSDLLNPTRCPDVCQQVNQFIADNTGQVNVNEIRQNLACGTETTTSGTIIGELPSETNPQPETGQQVTNQSFFSKYGIWIIVGAIILLLLIAVLIFIVGSG